MSGVEEVKLKKAKPRKKPAPKNRRTKIGQKRPKILVVTPEITYLPEGMGNLSQRMCAKAGGLADVSASLVSELYDQGAAVHLALPNYRRMRIDDVKKLHEKNKEDISNLPEKRIYFAEDRIFYHRDEVYSDTENTRIALAFQREVINHVIPAVQPQLIHCNDWMTGLIPAVAKSLGIKCLFTVHNIHTEKMTLAEIEDRGIDAAAFWENLYYESQPQNYEQTRSSNSVNLLASGIFAADHVNTVSPTFLEEIVRGQHDFVPNSIRHELSNKNMAGCASGILNAPDAIFEPETDPYVPEHYSAKTHAEGKRANKRIFQERLGLERNDQAPIFFWPSRLDPVQKGCQLVTDILYQIISDYWDDGLQVAVVANGAFQDHFRSIAKSHSRFDRIAVHDFNEGMSHLGYAASDFMLMPSSFEPCGLPQMISPKFGTLAVVHDTGGIHDTVEPLVPEEDRGNGFLFEHFGTDGLRWAIDQAMQFYRRPAAEKERQLSRVMTEAKVRFRHDVTAASYIDLYRKMLGGRPLVSNEMPALDEK